MIHLVELIYRDGQHDFVHLDLPEDFREIVIERAGRAHRFAGVKAWSLPEATAIYVEVKTIKVEEENDDMTTAVIVKPAGHAVKVEKIYRTGGEEQTQEEVVLPANSPQSTFYIHSTMDVRISEVPSDG